VRRLLSPRWLALHVLAVGLVAACLRLGWWQWQRAGEGNLRSLGYALEWPFFAAFVVLLWAYLVRDALRGSRRDERVATSTDDPESALLAPDPRLAAARRQAAEETDDELAAYNEYLARLNAEDSTRKSS
jgi:DNA-binding transcriptional regulator of glucitol operon